jgi:Transposase DDE domain
LRRHQFEIYLDKVFEWTGLVASMAEGRQNPPHPWAKVFDAVFLGSACQFGPVHRIEAECNHGVLEKRIGPLSEDTIGYALQRQSPEQVFNLGCQVARQLKRNGVLRSDWARGRVVAAVDGIEICSSYCRCCETCLQRTVERKVEGKLEQCTQYYHRLSAVTVVSTPFPVFLGIRFQKSGETEVACSLALLQELVDQLGKRFVDILVADALYLQTPFVRALDSLGLEWVINLKDNQPELAAEAERLTNRSADYRNTSAAEELQLWHLPEVDWPVADRLIGVVKTVRVQNVNRVAVHKHDGPPIKQRQPAPLVSTNFYATNVDLGAIPPGFIHQLGRSRWAIDAQAFQTLTTDCHLKQPSVHQSCALVVLTMIRVLAYTLAMVFYFRQVRSHARTTPPSFCEMARRFGYAFLALRFDSS